MVASEELLTKNTHQGGALYPRESETREVKSLDGFWNFRTCDADPLLGFSEKWFTQDLAKVSANCGDDKLRMKRKSSLKARLFIVVCLLNKHGISTEWTCDRHARA